MIKIVLVLSLVIFSISLKAQFWLGYSSSNYAGVHAMDINPAAVADNRYLLDINLVSTNFNLTNSYIGFKDGFIGGLMRGEANFMDNYVHERRAGEGPDQNSIFMNTEIMGPSAMLSFANQGFGLSIRARNYFNIDNVSDDLAHAAIEELNYPSVWGIPLNHDGFSIQDMMWMEYGFDYGRVVYNSGEHFVKGGAKLKLLQGLASAYMYSEALNVTIESDSTISLDGSHMAYGHSTNFDELQAGGYKPSFEMVSKMGIGLDLGVVYEWRPDYKDYLYEMDGEKDIPMSDQNKYKLKIGFSILDMGSMKWDKGIISHDFNPTVNDWWLDPLQFDDLVYAFDDTLKNRFPELSGESTYKMSLPTTFSLQVDYHIVKDLYVNFTAYQARTFKNRVSKIHNVSTYAITPRYDWKWFGVYAPVSYNAYGHLNAGLSAMIGPIILGTRNLLPMFSKNTVNGLDFYFGLKASWLNRIPSDRDHDKVSDKMDQCIDIAGLWEFSGCPDTDGDSIPDELDKCPKEFGLREFEGCPDSDADGVMDSKDECPDEAGLIELAGCPDRDGDGIADKDDECPDAIGLLEYNGCPDRDGDTVIDKLDVCPDKPGLVEKQGCPDTDGDGLYDNEDGCIENAGPLDNNGCPYQDRDGDGVIDRKDDCPDEVGPVENKGCPLTDFDNDGVLNEDDECPQTPGTVENNGCPELEKEEEEILNTAFNDLEFESGKAIIKFESHEALTELGLLLTKKPEWQLKLSGHTDNVGAAQANLKLSKDRSEAVKAFLVERGIDANRIQVEYFGETQPIETNDTPEGRQRNRRVEMKVIFE